MVNATVCAPYHQSRESQSHAKFHFVLHIVGINGTIGAIGFGVVMILIFIFISLVVIFIIVFW